MKYFKIFLALIIIIILGIFLFLTKGFEEFDGGDVGSDLILFNLKDWIDTKTITSKQCDITNYRYPEQGNDNKDNFDKINYIIDSNFRYFPNILGFTMRYQSTLHDLHSKLLLGAENLTNADFMGCGETDKNKNTYGLRIIGSDIFHNNIGKIKNQGEKHRLTLNLYEGEESGSLIPIPLEKKKLIIIYPETITRLSNIYDELKTLSPTTSMVGSTQKVQLSYSDLNDNEDIDEQIYKFLYEKTFSDKEYIKLIYRALGVEESLITSKNFLIGKTSTESTSSDGKTLFKDLIKQDGDKSVVGKYAGDSESGFTTYSDAIIKNNFRLVYYKDVLFSTDLGYWRTNIYNKLNPTQDGQVTERVIPDYISKYSLFSDNVNDNKRLSFIEILQKMTECRRQIHILSNINKYGNLNVELISNKNKDVLNKYLEDYNNLRKNFIYNDGSQSDLINLSNFKDIVENVDDCDECESIMPKIDQNGFIIPPDNPKTPEYVENIYPKDYPVVSTNICETFYGGGDTCKCSSYLLPYTYDGKTENVYILTSGDLSIDKFSSMYSSSEEDRFKLLLSNINLFNPYTPVNASKKFIEFTQLFHNIPTQMEYIKSL